MTTVMTRMRPAGQRSPTVLDLVGTFQLRRQASTEAFRDGISLARSGSVHVSDIADDSVTGEVLDPKPIPVEITLDGDALRGRCQCRDSEHGVCRHLVAIAHTVWVDEHLARDCS
jgi:uncharacterized Zn finger protein